MDLKQQAAAWTACKEMWSGTESVNGPGSTMELTIELRAAFPGLLERYGIKSILDAPCGDWNWMQHVDLTGVTYTGWDVEPGLVAANRDRFASDTVSFEQVNLLAAGTLFPAVDLILCKDFLFHITNEEVFGLLARFRASGSKYLLATHMPGASNDRPYAGESAGIAGYFARSLDVCAEPFRMPAPLEEIREADAVQPGYDMSDNLVGHTLSLFAL